jgi:alkylation response protein AidB-like acyl-CoA dehydrogenase
VNVNARPGGALEPDPAEHALVEARIGQLLNVCPPKATTAQIFLGAQFDAGLSAIDFPIGAGGLGVSPRLQPLVTEALYEAGAPNAYFRNPIGVGHAAPTLVRHGTAEQLQRFLRPMFSSEEIWCQLFSEPGAGSDLAGLSTRAVRDGAEWVVNGQKCWTSLAHLGRWGLLLARTDPHVPKHQGLTYFIADMTAPGVEIRPLRQMTGDAEFNEVFLVDVHIPDEHRVGAVGDGWRVAITTLMNERIAMGGAIMPRGSGLIGEAVRVWQRCDSQSAPLRDRLAKAWIDAEVQRLTSVRAQQNRDRGIPGPEGSIGKLASTQTNMNIYDLILEMLGADGMLYGSYELEAPRQENMASDGKQLNTGGYFTDTYEKVISVGPGLEDSELLQGYLRSRANGIEAGSSEIMRNVLAERVLGLPGDIRVDREVPWNEVPRQGR